jgi:hypothetical protein
MFFVCFSAFRCRFLTRYLLTFPTGRLSFDGRDFSGFQRLLEPAQVLLDHLLESRVEQFHNHTVQLPGRWTILNNHVNFRTLTIGRIDKPDLACVINPGIGN